MSEIIEDELKKVSTVKLVVFTAAAFFSATLSTAFAENEKQVFIESRNNFLVYVYPRTPYISSDRILVSFPYFFEALGGRRIVSADSVGIRLFNNSISLSKSTGAITANGKEVGFVLEKDNTTGTNFIALSPILKALKLPYSFDNQKHVLNIWGANYFNNILNSGAGTPFDNYTPNYKEVYPLKFSFVKALTGRVPDNISNPATRQGAPQEGYNLKLYYPLSAQDDPVNLLRLYTHLNDPTGYFQQSTLKGVISLDDNSGSIKCSVKKKVADCISEVKMYYNSPSKIDKNPIFFVLYKTTKK